MNETTQPESRPRKKEYSFNKQQARRDKRHDEANERNHVHSILNVMDKLAKARKRRGDSKKEIARLTALLPLLPKVTPKAAPKAAPKISPAPLVAPVLVVVPGKTADGKGKIAPRKPRSPATKGTKAKVT